MFNVIDGNISVQNVDTRLDLAGSTDPYSFGKKKQTILRLIPHDFITVHCPLV